MRIHQTNSNFSYPGSSDQYCFQIVNNKNLVKFFYQGNSSKKYERDLEGWGGIGELTSRIIYKDNT